MENTIQNALNKIWGCWTGKIAGGTYGQLVEGWQKKRIQRTIHSLTGWMRNITKHKSHTQIINDDEQYELIALLVLESFTDEEITRTQSRTYTLGA